MELEGVMKDTADAIREKTGKSDLIAPVDFASEIKSISVGGGESGGDWHYFDVSGLEGIQKTSILQWAMMHKVKGESIESALGIAGVVMPTGFGYLLPVENEITAIGVDYSIEVRMGEQSAIIGSSINTAPWYGQVPEITKEQFYDLNA